MYSTNSSLKLVNGKQGLILKGLHREKLIETKTCCFLSILTKTVFIKSNPDVNARQNKIHLNDILWYGTNPF
jgi:hypothetical protein